MGDSPYLNDENPRVAAYARATGAQELDHNYNFWISSMMREACEAGEAGDFKGVFRFDKHGTPHINDHDAFTSYLQERAIELESARPDTDDPGSPGC